MVDVTKYANSNYEMSNQEMADFIAIGKQIYKDKYKEKIEQKHKGEVAAIEIESGAIFIGKTKKEAYTKGKQKYPKRIFYLVKIGGKFTRRRIP